MAPLTITVEQRVAPGSGGPELVMTIADREVHVPVDVDNDEVAFDAFGRITGAILASIFRHFADEPPMPATGLGGVLTGQADAAVSTDATPLRVVPAANH